MKLNPREPYNELPLLPPEQEIETREVLRKCVSASRALAELKGAGKTIPNQSIIINAIPLQEALNSSEIENIVTTQDELYHAAIGSETKVAPQTKEVLRYRTALWEGYKSVRSGKFKLSLLETLCSTIRDEKVRFRSEEGVYIGNPELKRVSYTPPVGKKVIAQKLKNLEEFILRKDTFDPLVSMAVSHYQFEAIHPFTDGNGRTGRILSILQMLHYGLLEIPVLYLSRYIISTKPEYYKRLRAVTESGEWEQWVLYMLTAVEETSVATRKRIGEIARLFDETLQRCRDKLPRNVYSKELVELLFVQPYCKIRFLEDAGIAKRQTASMYMQELEAIGVLESEKRGREVFYKNPALLRILSA